MEDPGTFGRWLVRHVVALTFGSLLLLVALAVAALSLVQVEQTLEASGTVERMLSGELGVSLQLPAAEAARVMTGQAVLVQTLPPREGAVLSLPSREGQETGGASVLVSVEVEPPAEPAGSEGLLQEGSIVQARIIIGRQRASERLFQALRRVGGG